MLISASIVTYNNSYESLRDLIESLLASSIDRIYVIENTPITLLSTFLNNKKIIYLHNPSNPGFGASHNIALKDVIDVGYDYHFVINPDINLSSEVISRMVSYMHKEDDIGMLMPRIEFPNGNIQYLPKLLPTPFSLIMRKLRFPKFLHNKIVSKFELHFVDENLIYSAPVISGCFTLFRLNAIKEVGMYDDRFYMYFEDWDLSRRIHGKYKTIYFPKASVFHGYESGANKSGRLFKIFVKSAINYFNKWGWFFDIERSKINNKTLLQFK